MSNKKIIEKSIEKPNINFYFKFIGKEKTKIDYEKILINIDNCFKKQKLYNNMPQNITWIRTLLSDFDEEYLNSCKESVISTIKASMDNPSGIINTYFAKYFVDSDTSEKRIENINKVTKEDIINLGKKIKLHTEFILKGVNDEED